MHMKTKISTLLFALVASTGMLFADIIDHVQIGELYYNLNTADQTAEVTNHINYGNFQNYPAEMTYVEVPSSVTHDDVVYQVTAVGRLAFMFCHVTHFVLPSSIKRLGEYAFGNCDMTYMTLPDGIETIEDYAFYFCQEMNNINIPRTVTNVGYAVFAGCNSLTTISVATDNSTFDSRNNCNAIIKTATNTLTNGCKNTTIPNTVTEIGRSAFEDCHSLTAIQIPTSVTRIGEHAFEICIGLTYITIPNSVTSIGDCAFENCSALTTLTIPASVTEIGDNILTNSQNVQTIYVAADNPVYDSREDCNAIIETASNKLICACKNTVIPNTVTTIGSGAFRRTPIQEVMIPQSVTSIEPTAFYECFQLLRVLNNAPVPQPIVADVFQSVNIGNCLLVVPLESVPLYKAAEVWQNFLFMNLTYDDYSACELELVGDAIPEQEGATVDPSSWHWGNVFPMGTPVEEGFIYTWTVENVHIATTGYGFKIRTKNAAESGGIAAFNYGVGGRSGENLTVEEDAYYDITFIVNAVTSEMTYRCEKHMSEDIESISASSSDNVTKVLRNGQILIIKNEKTYTLTGQEVE